MSRAARLARAEFDAAEMAVYCPERYDECQRLVDQILAEPRGTVTTARASSLSDARAQLTASHLRNGIDSAFTRALETSERRAAYAKRNEEWLAKVSLQMAADHAFRKADPKGFIRSLRK